MLIPSQAGSVLPGGLPQGLCPSSRGLGYRGQGHGALLACLLPVVPCRRSLEDGTAGDMVPGPSLLKGASRARVVGAWWELR